MYGFGRGLFGKPPVKGGEISASKLFRVRAGQFIYSRLKAFEGAFAVVPVELDGRFVTNEFPTFDVIADRLDPTYIGYFFRTPDSWATAARNSTGIGARRERLHPEQLLDCEIPLPPVAEQRRIVARVDAIASRLADARRLKAESKGESDRIWKMLSRMARETAYPVRTLADMADFLDGRRVPLSEVERALRKGVYPYYGASGVIDHIDDFLFDEPLLLLSEDGANLINRSTPIAFIARGKYWVNNHAHVLKPKDGVADIEFLRYALSDFEVGVFNFASAQAKLNQKNAMRIAFPLPPLTEQRRIVAHLDAVQAKADALRRLQSESAAELDALLPAVLAKAFAGEL